MTTTVKTLSANYHHYPVLTTRLSSPLPSKPSTPPLLVAKFKACWELCRLHNNIGFWVVWLPTAWSIGMAYHATPNIRFMSAVLRALYFVPLCFGVKSLIMTIDDILDHDVDRLVERTKNRAIPRGAISLPQAWAFFIFQVIVGILSARYFLSRDALLISITVWPIYLIYPTCKRWTNLAPIPLGVMFNVGVFMGWSDLLDVPARWGTLIPVYLGAILWTCTYETVYQHQDKVDDIKIGLHSPALLLGKLTTGVCACTAMCFFGLLGYGGWINGHGIVFYAALAIAAVRLMKNLFKTDLDQPDDCKAFFLDTRIIGSVIMVGLISDSIAQRLLNNVPL